MIDSSPKRYITLAETTRVSLVSAKLGAVEARSFDWRTYVNDGDTMQDAGVFFKVAKNNPDLEAQSKAASKVQTALAKEPLVRSITYSKPFSASYEITSYNNNNDNSNISYSPILALLQQKSSYRSVIKIRYDGKRVFVETELFIDSSSKIPEEREYELFDGKTDTIMKQGSSTSASIDDHFEFEPMYTSALAFVPYSINWKQAYILAPLENTPVLLAAEYNKYLVAADQGAAKISKLARLYNWSQSGYDNYDTQITDQKLINGVWIPVSATTSVSNNVSSSLKLLDFTPMMPPASEFDMLAIMKHTLTAADLDATDMQLKGNSKNPLRANKMVVNDLRNKRWNMRRHIRDQYQYVVDLNGAPIAEQIDKKTAPFFRPDMTEYLDAPGFSPNMRLSHFSRRKVQHHIPISGVKPEVYPNKPG
jgi:hypothetical protein